MANVLEETKAVLTSQQPLTTTTNKSTSTIREKDIIISIKYSTIASVQNHIVTPSHIKTAIDNPTKISNNKPTPIANNIHTTTPSIIKVNTVLVSLINTLK